MALGEQVVNTYTSGSWEVAGSTQTFWHFFLSIVPLYLLYRLVQWLLGLVATKTAKTVDNSMQDNKTYTDVRDRVRNVFEGRTIVPPERAQSNPTPTPPNNPGRCPSCNVLGGRIHLSGCQRNTR